MKPKQLAIITPETIATLGLEDLETIVDEGVAATYTTSMALATIHDRRLYRRTHKTFEAYAFDRFGITLTTARRWVELGAELSRAGSGAHELTQGAESRATHKPVTPKSVVQPASRRATEKRRAAKKAQEAIEVKAEPVPRPAGPKPVPIKEPAAEHPSQQEAPPPRWGALADMRAEFVALVHVIDTDGPTEQNLTRLRRWVNAAGARLPRSAGSKVVTMFKREG